MQKVNVSLSRSINLVYLKCSFFMQVLLLNWVVILRRDQEVTSHTPREALLPCTNSLMEYKKEIERMLLYFITEM